MDRSGVNYLWIIVMFLSAVWTLILTAPIHCRGSTGEQVMEWYISPNLMKKQTHLEWPEGEQTFSKFLFWLNYFFNKHIEVLYVRFKHLGWFKWCYQKIDQPVLPDCGKAIWYHHLQALVMSEEPAHVPLTDIIWPGCRADSDVCSKRLVMKG